MGNGERQVIATAPVRVCDAGGWTDTWFARRGVVCNLAVGPGVQVRVRAAHRVGPTTVGFDIPAYGDRYTFAPSAALPGRHPLLEAAVVGAHLPEAHGIRIRVRSALPPGCGTGTSAAVLVALLGALRALREEPAPPGTVAAEAHRVETVALGLQCGVQDQLAAAHGGANLIEIADYPVAHARPLALGADVLADLERRLVTIYLGRPHRSSAIHEQVIASLERAGDAETRLAPLRAAAHATADALRRGDLDGYGAALTANTEAQADLHPDLVCDAARHAAEIACAHGAAGWKVNGAGGDGGTVTVVGPPDGEACGALRDALAAVPGWEVLPLRPSTAGLAVETS